MAVPRRTHRGRHAALSGRTRLGPQLVRAVLLGISAASLGLVALLPAAGTTGHHRAAAAMAAPVTVPTSPATRRVLARADRQRPVVVMPSPSPAVAPSPRDVLPGCAVDAGATGGYANGRIPDRVLCDLPGRSGHALRADAARAFVQLDAAYRARFGERICLTDSYRSLAGQRTLAGRKPGLAARPGTSEHGWGLAVDLACGIDGFSTRQHRWMVENAEAYGWYQPSWARRGGGRPEPWHWELRD